MEIQRQGFCKYCGQSKIIEADEDMSQEIVDEMVTEDCNCNDAAKARSQKERKEKIEKFVTDHFRDDTRDFVKDAISLLKITSGRKSHLVMGIVNAPSGLMLMVI